MVIGTNVVCRAQPGRNAPKVVTLRLGEIRGFSRETRAQGDIWYFDAGRPSCWVPGPLTAEFVAGKPESALLAVADHILQRRDPVTFGEYIEAENLLLNDAFSSSLLSSGLLQFRRLQIVERVTRLPSAYGRIVFMDPLKRAWFIAHRDFLRYFEPDDKWFIRPEPYWSLFEKNKDAPWAEEVASTVGLRVIPSDECYSDCALSKIVQGPLQYWTRYPNGKSIQEALRKAVSLATYAVETSIYNAPPLPTLNEIRHSLANVTAPERRRLLDLLDEADRKYSEHR
jgi:hypothetical protein